MEDIGKSAAREMVLTHYFNQLEEATRKLKMDPDTQKVYLDLIDIARVLNKKLATVEQKLKQEKIRLVSPKTLN